MSPDIDAVYFLTTEAHIVDTLLADLDRGSYKSAHLVWTSLLDPPLRRRLEASPAARRVVGFETIPLDYFPRESHLITFRDPWSFPVLYHPACNDLVMPHMRILAHKVCAGRWRWGGRGDSVLANARGADYERVRLAGRAAADTLLQPPEPHA